MTNEQMLDAFLKPRGMTRTAGCDLEIVLPFFIMDAVYSIFNRSIRPLELEKDSWEADRREKWRIAYNRFNQPFFNSYKGDLEDAIIDKMDRFEQYMQNDLLMMQATIWRIFCKLEPERDAAMQNVSADCMLAEILSCMASIEGEKIVDSVRFQRSGVGFKVIKVPYQFRNAYKGIDEVRLKINDFINAYYKPTVHIRISDYPEIDDGMYQIVRRIKRFILNDAKENYNGQHEKTA